MLPAHLPCCARCRLQPPPEKSVVGAVRTLQEVGALTAEEGLTPLGGWVWEAGGEGPGWAATTQ